MRSWGDMDRAVALGSRDGRGMPVPIAARKPSSVEPVALMVIPPVIAAAEKAIRKYKLQHARVEVVGEGVISEPTRVIRATAAG